MSSPLSLSNVCASNVQLGKGVSKIENQRLYETQVFTSQDDKRKTIVFWSPELETMKKDDNHITLLLPQTDECEQFYNTLVHLEKEVINEASEKWKSWFPKDDLSTEDIQERFVSCVKAGSKEEQGRIMNLKTSSRLKCKVQNSEDITNEYWTLYNEKSKKGVGRVLIELKRVIFGRGNYKMEFVAHQVLLNEPEIEEPETERFNNSEWVDFE
jgi:hypothetical protein